MQRHPSVIESTLSDHHFLIREVGANAHQRGNGGNGDAQPGFSRGKWNGAYEDETNPAHLAAPIVHVLGGVALTPEGKRMLSAAASRVGASEGDQTPFLDGSHTRAGQRVPGRTCDSSGQLTGAGGKRPMCDNFERRRLENRAVRILETGRVPSGVAGGRG